MTIVSGSITDGNLVRGSLSTGSTVNTNWANAELILDPSHEPDFTLVTGGYDFDGTDDYHSHASAIVSAYPFAVAFWYRTDDNTKSQYLFTVNEASLGAEGFEIYYSGAGADAITFDARSASAASSATTSTTAADANWHHVVAFAASSTDRSVYLDGGGAGVSVVDKTPANLTRTAIGDIYRALGTFETNGMIASMSVWVPAATEIDTSGERDVIAAALALGADPRTVMTGLTHHWPLSAASLLTDSVGGADLTANGTPAGAPNSKVIAMADRSGKGNHVKQTVVANQPTLSTMGTDSAVCLDFDSTADGGAGQWLQSASAPVTAAPFFMTLAVSSDDETILQSALSISDKDSATDRYEVVMRGDVAGDPIWFRVVQTTGASAAHAGDYAASTVYRVSVQETSSASHNIWVDGVGLVTDTTTKAPAAMDNVTLGRTTLSTPVSPLSGKIGGLAVFSTAGTERVAAETWAAAWNPIVTTADLASLPTCESLYDPSHQPDFTLVTGGYSFDDGAEDYLSSAAAGVDIAYPCAVSLWYQHDAPTAPAGLVSFSDPGAVATYHVIYHNSTSGTVSVYTNAAGAGQVVATTVNANLGTGWVQVTCFLISATSRIIVLNGDWANRGTNTTSRTPTGLTQYIGISKTSAGFLDELDGRVSALSIWSNAGADDTERTAVALALAAGADPRTVMTGLIHHWPLSAASLLTDSVGTDDLTENGAPGAPNSKVIAMADLSGNGNHVQQLTVTKQPTLSTMGADSAVCLLFDDASVQTLIGPTTVTAAPMFFTMAVLTDDVTILQAAFGVNDNVVSATNDGLELLLRGDLANDPFQGIYSSVAGASTSPSLASVMVVDTVHIVSAMEASATSRAVWAEGSTDTGATSSTPTGITQSQLGGRATGLSLSGKIGGVAMFSTAGTERLRAEAWASKWAD